jgi:hypothetical protein
MWKPLLSLYLKSYIIIHLSRGAFQAFCNMALSCRPAPRMEKRFVVAYFHARFGMLPKRAP